MAGGVLGLALVLATGACGGGDRSTPPAPAAPGANVDPDATGVVGGSINKAKDAAEDAETRDAQLDGAGDTAP